MKYFFGEDFELVIDRIRRFLIYVGFLICLYYTVGDFIDRSSFENAPILISCLVGYFIGLFLDHKKSKRASAYIFLISTQFFMTYLILLSGGLSAPGIFWFSILPLLWTILTGVRGLFIGYGSIVITFLVYYLNGDSISVPDHIVQNIFKARLENLLLFTTFMMAFIYLYTKVLALSKFELEKKKREISTLLRILVHDISTPLTIVTSYSEILRDKGEYQEDKMDKILSSSRRIGLMIGNVKRLIALTDGKSQLNIVSTDLKECISNALESLELNVFNKKIKIKLVYLIENPIVEIDKDIFTYHVLVNLMSNAIKFSDIGKEIIVEVRKDKKWLYLDIIDQGVGIPQDIMTNLFSTYLPTTRDGTLGERGTGFGLPIVKEIMERHNGTIEVFSPPKKEFPVGTQVQLKIPV
jgi:signal transduction histidine kinase